MGGEAEARRDRQWSRRIERRVALAALAVIGGLALGIAFPVPGGRAQATALACGLGNTPTMLANNAPAMLYPVTKNTPLDQPIGIFTLNYVAGQQIAFGEDLSRVSGAPPVSSFKWRWDFGDGSGYSFDAAPRHTYAQAGTYNVHSQIYDDSTASWTDLDSATVTVIPAAIPNPPLAKLTASTPVVAVNGSITFDASGSRSSDSSPLTYQWNFNDGNTATGPRVTHTFAIQGSGLVALIVTDKRGARSVVTTTVVIVTTLMSASETSAAPGDTVSFDAGAALQQALPPGDTHVQFTWSFGDGTQPLQTQGPTASHTFTQPGQYAVQVQAQPTDQPGVAPALAAVAVTVTAPQIAQPATPQARGVASTALLVGGGGAATLAVLVIGFFLVRAQRRRNALIRERSAAMALARARHVRPNRSVARDPRAQPPTRAGNQRWNGPPGGGSQAGRRPGSPGARSGRPDRYERGPSRKTRDS